jgi:hypothetical protein
MTGRVRLLLEATPPLSVQSYKATCLEFRNKSNRRGFIKRVSDIRSGGRRRYLVLTSSTPRHRLIAHVIPALTPVMTAKLRACIMGPPANACHKFLHLQPSNSHYKF